jgi:hypothetical protein
MPLDRTQPTEQLPTKDHDEQRGGRGWHFSSFNRHDLMFAATTVLKVTKRKPLH